MRSVYFAIIFVGLFWSVELRENRVAIKPQPDGRIVGGNAVVNLEQIPYQISLQRSGNHFCGGSFISRQWVLTAAHCTDGLKASGLRIRAGSLQHSRGGVVVQVGKIIQHPKFNSDTIDFDFSLLQLRSWSPNSIIFEPAGLPNPDESIEDGILLTVSGWGNTQSANESSASLRAVQVPKFNQRTCNKLYRKYGGVTDRMICAGYSQGGKDSCQGDSGGPLSLNGTLIGVVSWGYGCAQPNFPGVYARVSTVRDWIKSTTGV